MSTHNLGFYGIATLRADVTRIVRAWAHVDLGISEGILERAGVPARRTAAVAKTAMLVAVVLAFSALVALAQQQLTARESARVETVSAPVVVPPRVRRAAPAVVLPQEPVAAPLPAPVIAEPRMRPSQVRAQPVEAEPAPRMIEVIDDHRFLIEADRCGRDPTCGI
jgi:hypothetical protein